MKRGTLKKKNQILTSSQKHNKKIISGFVLSFVTVVWISKLSKLIILILIFVATVVTFTEKKGV
jgi:hypothetical protein